MLDVQLVGLTSNILFKLVDHNKAAWFSSMCYFRTEVHVSHFGPLWVRSAFKDGVQQLLFDLCDGVAVQALNGDLGCVLILWVNAVQRLRIRNTSERIKTHSHLNKPHAHCPQIHSSWIQITCNTMRACFCCWIIIIEVIVAYCLTTCGFTSHYWFFSQHCMIWTPNSLSFWQNWNL